MYFKYILYSYLFTCVVSSIPTSIYQKINTTTSNIYTIQSNNLPFKNILSYTDTDINLFQIKFDNSVDIFSIYTKNYFARCNITTDPNCEYDIEEQETACKQYIDDHQNNNTYKMYYYGVYYNYSYNMIDYIILHDRIRQLKYNIKYETIGIYVIENINNTDIEIYKNTFNSSEPDNFYRQMMLYLIPGLEKTTFCPYWTIRNY
jgi:hypothetical protein